MDSIQFNPFEQNPETPFQDLPKNFEWEKPLDQDETFQFLADSMVCDSGSKLIPSGFTRPSCTEDLVLFLNAGSETSVELDSSLSFLADNFYQGGDTFQTEEFITEGGEHAFIYQSARLGNFCYRIDNLTPGNYFVDLHFVEIINVNGPKGMRVFNVFLQDEKVVSDFDIFSVVGANKPLQLVDSRVSIKDNGVLLIKFEGIIGSPVVSGICIRKAPEVSASQAEHDRLTCRNCAAEIDIPSAQKKVARLQATAKYEKKIQELGELLERKTDECYQSWMSYTAANQQLEKVRMELDNKTFDTYSLDQKLEKQAKNLTEMSTKYERDKYYWHMAINDLDMKVKKMKQEHSQLSREAHECADSIPDLNKMVFAVQSLVEQYEDLKMKYNEEQAKRRKLFNEVQEAKGNIRVFCRCRPLSKIEVSNGCSTVVDFDAANDGELGILNSSSMKKTFKFDRVYTPRDDQGVVYADASPMVISVLDGYNVCIFAYGQTGTGKTFTMEGTKGNRGVNYRTLEELFKIAKERSETFTYDISVSVLEVYNEQIRDLLSPPTTSKKLEIKQATEGLHHIPGVVEAKVENIEEVWNVLQTGSSARAVGSNNVNEHSSRSHCMLCIMVTANNLINGECTKSKLWLVDLAGSERLAKTDAQGDRLKEAQNINRSLSALGDVISALANRSNHIPYRNSKLTHLLQDSLGGDSKALMFVQISPSDKDLSETISSLNFATRVRGIELGPVRKQVDTSELQKLKMMLDKARQEAKSKDESLKKLEESLQNLESKAKGKEHVNKNQQDKIKELESQLNLKTSLHGQSEKQLSQLSERLKGREETCAALQQKVSELENKMRQQHQFESESLNNKVKDLEIKLKEREQEFASQSNILQHKVEELEEKLKAKEQNAEECILLRQKVEELEEKLKAKEQNAEECILLRQKIKELEDKIKEKEQQLACVPVIEQQLACVPVIDSEANSLRSIPLESKEENLTSEIEQRILRSSNSLNRQASQQPNFLKGKDSVQQVRRKRLSTNSETENNGILPTSSVHNRTEQDFLQESRRKRLSRNGEAENNAAAVSASDRRGRQSDPPKPFASGVPRGMKPTTTTTTNAQRPLIRNKTSREPVVQGAKERDAKKRMWSR
ncbi:PREDICTED: kinesin-like protein KIN-14R isoform X2 [Nicotiana attenuata]|uniref:Kinesin-4 n=1 Tax=Nicotiana attenuata TaxID=49451 RepID=A0A314L998_NICAT|nr:PREDICTED: kinesin-like protein KIN-14R isoform X2 [Nicotiana attenuata]OIT38073.1 kinesin-4 [Nicotiana attenuata]